MSNLNQEIMEIPTFNRVINIVKRLSESDAINLGGKSAEEFVGSRWDAIKLNLKYLDLLEDWEKNPSSFVKVLDTVDTKGKKERVIKILDMLAKDSKLKYDVEDIKIHADAIVTSLKNLEKDLNLKGKSLDNLFTDWENNPLSFLKFLKVKQIKEGNTEAFQLKDRHGDDRIVRGIMHNGNTYITNKTTENFIKTLHKVYVDDKFKDKIKVSYTDLTKSKKLPDITADNEKSGIYYVVVPGHAITIVTAGDKAYILDNDYMMQFDQTTDANAIRETLFQNGFKSVTFAQILFDDGLPEDSLLKNKRGDCVMQAEGLMAKLTNKLIGEKTRDPEITKERKDAFRKDPIKATQDVMTEFLSKSAIKNYEYSSDKETPKEHECEYENVVLEPVKYVKWHDRALLKNDQYALDSESNVLSVGSLNGSGEISKTTMVSKKDLTNTNRKEPKYFQKMLDDGEIKGNGKEGGVEKS